MVWAKTHLLKLGFDDGSKVCMSVGYGPQFWVWKALGLSLARHYHNFWIYQRNFLSVYMLPVCQLDFYQRSHEKKCFIEKTLLDDLWYVSEFVSNNFIDRFIDIKSATKNNLPVLFRWYFHQWIKHITDKKTLYNSIDDCFCLTAFSLGEFNI